MMGIRQDAFRVALVAMLALTLFAASEIYAQEGAVFTVQPADFIKTFNQFAAEFSAVEMNPNTVQREKGQNGTTNTYVSGKRTLIQFEFAPDSSAPRQIRFLGAPDGTKETSQSIMAGSLAFAASATQGLDQKTRGRAVRTLGLMPYDIEVGEVYMWRHKDMDLGSSYDPKIGLEVIARPNARIAAATAKEPAAKAAPQPAAPGVKIPAYDTGSYCKEMGDAMGGSSQIELTCRQSEAAAQERVAQMNASAKAMGYCDEMARAIGGSYDILATCLQEEMTAEAQLQ